MMVRNLLTLWLCCVSQTKIRIRAHMNLPCGRCQLNEYTAIKRGATMWSPAENISVLQQRNESYKRELPENKPLQLSTGPWSLGQPFEKKFLPQITDSIYNAIASLKKIHRAGMKQYSLRASTTASNYQSYQGYSTWHENMVILGVQKRIHSPKA